MTEQSPLTRDNDRTKSAESLAVVDAMVAALGRGDKDMERYFADGFTWRGNAGCGVKAGLAAFRRDWQLPLRAAFSNRTYLDEARIADGQWVAAFGYIDATHTGSFMGIAPTGKRLRIRYTDFWKVVDGKIADNWVTVDFPDVLRQLGVDVFDGHGWEAFDNGTMVPPAVDQGNAA